MGIKFKKTEQTRYVLKLLYYSWFFKHFLCYDTKDTYKQNITYDLVFALKFWQLGNSFKCTIYTINTGYIWTIRYVEPEEYWQYTVHKPYQLVLWTISTKRKMHTCTVTFTSWCWQWGRGFLPIATLDKPPLWASVWSENWEDCAYLKLVICKVEEHHFQDDNLTHKKISPSFRRPRVLRPLQKPYRLKGFRRWEDVGCQKRRQETKPKSRSCKNHHFSLHQRELEMYKFIDEPQW